MFKVAVCDGDYNDLNFTITLLEKYFSERKIHYNITPYIDEKFFIQSKEYYDIIFLEIILKKMNGINLAKQIRLNNNVSKIIFISSVSDYLKEGYSVHAERYFIKPLLETEFFYEMNQIIKELEYNDKYIYSKDIAPFKIRIKSIVCIEFRNRKTIIYLESGQEINNYCPLKQLYNLIDNDSFVKTHRAFIINLHYLKSVDLTYVTLYGGKIVPLTRFYKENFNRAYYKFLEQSR